MPDDDPPFPSDSMSAPASEQAALARLGTAVCKRLEADPAAYRVPVDRADVFTVGEFLSAQECAHLIAMIDRVAQPSRTYAGDGADKTRTSYSGDVDPNDSFVRMIERRICDLLGIDPRWGETVQGQRYEVGQEFHAHYDWFDTKAAYWPDEIGRGGQRSWTAMAYLSDMPEGGATSFPQLGLSVQPQPGALLIWNNMLPDGSPNPDVRHAALPVVSGVKYVITKWFRTRPWG
jgi:prolyl 4-hydroxylase